MTIEQRPIIAARGGLHVTEGMLRAEEELKVVGAGIADMSGFADHAQDIRLIQQSGVYGGTNLMRQLVLEKEGKRLAELVVEHGAIRQFP